MSAHFVIRCNTNGRFWNGCDPTRETGWTDLDLNAAKLADPITAHRVTEWLSNELYPINLEYVTGPT